MTPYIVTKRRYFYLISLAITFGHSWSLVVTRGHSWSLVVTRGHSWSLVVTRGHSWSLVVTRGHSWSLVVTRDHSWSLVCTFRPYRLDVVRLKIIQVQYLRVKTNYGKPYHLSCLIIARNNLQTCKQLLVLLTMFIIIVIFLRTKIKRFILQYRAP